MNMFSIPLDASSTQLVSYGVALTSIMAVYIWFILALMKKWGKTHEGRVMVRLGVGVAAIPVSALATNTARLIIPSMNSDNIPLIFSSVLIGSFVLINILTTPKDPPSALRGGI